MRRKALTVDDSAKGLPISQALVSGDLVFVSGQVCPDREGVVAQTRCILERIGLILRASGSDYRLVARCGVYLGRAEDFGAMNRVYREFFGDEPPARTTIVCSLLDARMLVEIDCVARVP